MNKTFKIIALFASVLIILLFIIFVINQTAQVVELADKVSLVQQTAAAVFIMFR